MYFHDGRPLIQTADWVSTEADLIHHKELKAVYKYFCDKKFPDKIELGQKSLTIFEKDEKSELYVQAEDDMGGCWTCFKTYKTIVIGYSSNPDADRKAMRKGMQRVIDFFLRVRVFGLTQKSTIYDHNSSRQKPHPFPTQPVLN